MKFFDMKILLFLLIILVIAFKEKNFQNAFPDKDRGSNLAYCLDKMRHFEENQVTSQIIIEKNEIICVRLKSATWLSRRKLDELRVFLQHCSKPSGCEDFEDETRKFQD